MPSWSPHDIPDLRGKTIVITGANTGLGYASAALLAPRGPTLVLACRNLDKAATARDSLLADHPAAQLETAELDLARFDAIHAFAKDLSARHEQIDVLLNNAGIMGNPYGLTPEGFELHFGVNHLGPFVLTNLLLPMLHRAPDARIVTVSSSVHRSAKIDFTNLQYGRGKGYTPLRAYARSKLANLLFAYELQRRLSAKKSPIRSLAAHPGAAQTDLGRQIESDLIFRILRPLLEATVPSPAQGAWSQVRAATDPKATGGAYYGPDGMFRLSGAPVHTKSSRASYDASLAARLWDASEHLTGTRYTIP